MNQGNISRGYYILAFCSPHCDLNQLHILKNASRIQQIHQLSPSTMNFQEESRQNCHALWLPSTRKKGENCRNWAGLGWAGLLALCTSLYDRGREGKEVQPAVKQLRNTAATYGFPHCFCLKEPVTCKEELTQICSCSYGFWR